IGNADAGAATPNASPAATTPPARTDHNFFFMSSLHSSSRHPVTNDHFKDKRRGIPRLKAPALAVATHVMIQTRGPVCKSPEPALAMRGGVMQRIEICASR